MSYARLADLGSDALGEQLSGDGLRLRVGPYCYAIQSPEAVVARGLATLYGDFPLVPAGGFADFHVTFGPTGWRQRLRGQLDFFLDERRPFGSVPRSQAYAFLEWGLNWCLSVTMNEYLKLHAAVVAKDGIALVMPGLPGAGKSTLCAALALRGWRVLSDEHALIPPGRREVVPVYRPVSLKNASINVIRGRDAAAVIGPVSNDTHKGSVAHLKADLHPDSHCRAPVAARLMVFPEFQAGAPLELRPKGRAESFLFAAHHAFNYSLLREAGFDAMCHFIDGLDCFDLRYSDLDAAVARLDALVGEFA
ncbi:HprK-related kinase A [Parahaliea mediterranea]|uniref:HprK-related kinase A n=1 Tax=Parahaliea mediterranea TaxID=651086 RepID=UPI0019D43CBA|nr:HprK-related kinase A [Parahaliea mediterranea]